MDNKGNTKNKTVARVRGNHARLYDDQSMPINTHTSSRSTSHKSRSKHPAHARESASLLTKVNTSSAGVVAGVALASSLVVVSPALALQGKDMSMTLTPPQISYTKPLTSSTPEQLLQDAGSAHTPPSASAASSKQAKASASQLESLTAHTHSVHINAAMDRSAGGGVDEILAASASGGARATSSVNSTSTPSLSPMPASSNASASGSTTSPTGAQGSSGTPAGAQGSSGAQGTSTPGQPNGSNPRTNDTSNQQVVRPNVQNPTAGDVQTANGQVARPADERKTVYNLTVRYAVSGNVTKQLLQPTEFSFTEAKLEEISKPDAEGVYIPVPTTKGYVAPRGKYVKNAAGKFVLDTEQNASVQTYMRIDRRFIEQYKNRRLSKDDNVVSEFTLEYNPKQVTFYVRHMLQNPNYDPHITNPSDERSKPFIEYTGLNDKVQLQDEEGHWHTVCVSKAIGLVGSRVFAQPVNIEGYSPEPNLVGSSIPDDAYYTEADEDEATNPSTTEATNPSAKDRPKHLVFELRYLLKKHEVSYDVQGGTAIQGHVYKFGEKMLQVKNPTRRGYEFTGWTVKGIKGKEHEAPSLAPNFTEQTLPDNDVEFVAHWKPAHQETSYWVNVWVQKARLVKPNDPNSLDNYDYVGRVQRKGKSDANIENEFTKYNPSFDAPTDMLNGKYRVIKGTLTAEERKQVHFDGLDTTNDRIKDDVEKVLASDKEFDRFYKPNYQLENRLNAGEAPEWFGAKEMRPLYKLRPDGTTVLNAVYDRQVYTYYFAKPDGSKKSTDADPYSNPPKPGDPDYKGNARGSSTTVTIGGKKWTYDKDKLNSAYSIKVRFNEELRPGIEFPKTAQITYSPVDRTHDIDGREIDGSKEEPQANMGLYILGDATNFHKGKSDGDNVFDTPPYRFGFEDVYYTREVEGADFYNKKDFFCFSKHYHQDTSTTEVGSYDYNPYQRLFTPFPMDTRQFRSNEPSNGPFHVVIRVETPESAAARLKDPHAKPQYKISVMSYTQYNYIYRGEGKFDNSSLLGWDGFEPPKLIGYARGKSSSGGDPSIWNNEDEYFFGNSEQKPILDPNAPIPKTHMQCVYELLYQDYCTYLKAKGESPVALGGDKEKDKGEKERFKAYVYEKWKDAFDFTYKKVGENTYVQEGIDKNGKTKEVPVKYPFSAILVWTYDRTTPTIRFHNDASSDVEDAQGHAATIQSPFDTDLFKKDFIVGGHITDDGTTLTPTITPYTPQGQAPEQFPGTYRFQLNGKDYFIKRPDNLPIDYVFDGWALDANGSQVLIPHMKSDGTAMTAQDIIEYVKKQTTKRVVPDAGLTLYAHWVPSQITHKITVNMNRDDMPNAHSEVFVTHGHHAHKAKNDGLVRDKKDIPKDEFPLPADRPGYVFYGWQVKTKDIHGNDHWLPFAFSTPVVDDLEVRAEWVEDKRVTGTVRQVFLNPGCTIKQYEAAKAEAERTGDRTKLESLIHNVRTETLHELRPGSATSVQAGYRDDEYFPDHTYSTFVVNNDPKKNTAEFVYEPYAKRNYTVHYIDAQGNEIAPAEPQPGNVSVYTTNKLNYNVVEAKTIPGYVLRKDIAAQYQFVIKPEADGSYKPSYDYKFIYDDVRILKRSNDKQVTPDHYSRLVFKTESTELVVKDNKVVSQLSAQPGGELKPFAFDPTAPESNVQEIVLDALNGTKAYQLPLPTPVAKEGYTFVGWTSEDYYDGQKFEGANRLPANSQTFDHKTVFIAHFKKTENAFVGSDPKAETPPGYYKVNYTADQNGRLSRLVPDGHGGTKTETLDTLTNVVVLDKYKVNNINAPTPVPDKGFQAIDGFTFDGHDAKDRTYTKHFVMIDPVAVAHRYVLPGNPVLAVGETAKSLIQNADQYKNEEDALPGKLATYRFLDEAGHVVTTLDNSTPGEHKIFIEVEAGREGYRVKKKVPFFYTIMPRAFLQGELSKYNPQDVATYYKKYTFKSKPTQGIMTGRETAQTEGDYETLAAYVYAGTAAAPAGTYTLDVPSAAGRDFEADGYHYVFRGWKKVVGTSVGSSAPDALPADFKWKTFKPDIGAKDHYKDIKPTDNAAYVAMYEKIPYIVQKSEDGTVPPDSVVVSFKPAAGRAWKDGKTGPKVLYIKKGMDISMLDEHGVPIKPGETKKSILQVLGEQLYGYTGDWTKSSMDGITLIEHMSTGAGTDGWKSNNAFQEFVAHQTPYTDPVGGVEKTIIQGTKAPAAIDFVKNADQFKTADGTPFDSISAEYVEAPSTDAAANLTVPIKVMVKYKDSADTTHTRVYNITGSLHVLGDVLEKKNTPRDPALISKYTTITFVSKKQNAPLKEHQAVADKEAPGQVSGATDNGDQSELQYLAYKKDDANYTITIPQVTGKDYEVNGYHYVFTGWKKVQSGAHAQDVLLDANQRTLSFDAQENVVYEAQYKKVPYITTKTDNGSIPEDSVVAAFKPAPGRTWKDGTNGPKTFYVKKGQDVHKLPFDIVENGVTKHYKSIIDYFKDQLFDNTGWSKSSMEDVQGIESVGEGDWIANNAFQEYVAKQTDYTLPVLGKAQTIIQGTTIPDAETFVSNLANIKNAPNVEKVSVRYTETPSSTEAANYTVPLEITVTYKDSASQSRQKVYNLVGYLNVLGDVLEKKNAPSDPALTSKYTTITFVSKKAPVVDASGHETGQTEEPGQVSGATESADNTQSELAYLTFKKDGASYTIDVPKVSGLDYTANGYHYVFTGWKQVVTPASGVTPLTIGAADRNYKFNAQQSIVFEAQYDKVPYVVEKSKDGTVPPDSVVVSFKPAAGRAWKDGKTGPKVLYIKKGVDISKIDQHGKPVSDPAQSILAWLGSQLYGYGKDWTKSSMEGIEQINNMKDHPDAWLSNNAFQEFVAHQTPYTDPVGGVAKTIIQGTTAPDAIDFVQNANLFKSADGSPFESIRAEYETAPATDAAANLTVPIKVTVKYKDSADITHTRVYNITGSLHVLGNVLKSENAPREQELKDKYTTITFVTKKAPVVDEAGHPTGTQEDQGQLSGANDQGELQYLTYKTAGAQYDIAVPKVSGLDYTANGYHYVFTGWKKTTTSGTATALLKADDRQLSFDAQESVVYEAQYKKISYIMTKTENGTVPPDSVVVSFKPAPGRKWSDGSTGPKVLYIRKGMDISRLDEHGKPIKANDTTTPSILDVLGGKLSGYDHDWSKSSMEGIDLINSMKEHGAALPAGSADDAWKSNDAFQEFVAHQTPHSEPQVIENYIAVIQKTPVPSPNDFIKNDKDLKALLMKNNVVVPGKENIESYTVEFIGTPPSSNIGGTFLVPLKVTIKYHDMDKPKEFKLQSQLKVIYGVLYGKNKPSKAKAPIDYQVFNEHYRKVTFITDDNEKNQHKGTIIGDENSKSVDYYVAKDQELRVRVPKILNQDYEQDGYHYKFVGWKLVPSADTAVKDDKHELTDTDIKFGTSNADSLKVTKTAGDLIYKAVYEKIKYVENKPVDGTVPADSVVVSFKPAPGRKWADGSTGPKVLYIKKDTDISLIDKDGKPVSDPNQSVLAWLGTQLHDYEGDWSKSDMEGITAVKSMKEAHDANSKAWLSKDAFQEFVAHQKPVVEPEAVSEIVIAQNGKVPTLEEFVRNLSDVKNNNIALDDQGHPIFKIETIGKMPTSKVAATYTIPWTITLKHADMGETITYKRTTVLRVMGDVYDATDSKAIIDSITQNETPDSHGKTTPLTQAQQKFKDSYACVVFNSGAHGTLSGGDTDTTLTRYVKTKADIDLAIPGVNPQLGLDDHDGKGKYDYIFDHWNVEVIPNDQGAGADGTGTPGAGAHDGNTAQRRSRRSADVFPAHMLFAVDNNRNGSGVGTGDNTANPGGTPEERLAATLRRLKRQFDTTYPHARYQFTAVYKKVYYVTSAKDVDSVPAGFVPVVAFPAPGHTWEDGSVDPDIYYVKSGESFGEKRQAWEKGLANLRGWKYLGASGKQITDPAALATIDRPIKALTLIAEQYDLPELKPKNDVVITEGDTMPSYNEMVEDTPQINPETGTLLLDPHSQNPAMINGVEAFSTLQLNPRFAGWETDRNSYAKLPTDKPGIYRVRFGLKYYTDEQEIDPKTKQPVVENGKVKHKVAIKWVDVNVHILPRVITEQDLPADGTREARFVKTNYTKVTYRVALGDHGFVASPNTTFYVRRGYTIDPNALLNFDKDKRAKRLQEMQQHAVDQKQLQQEIGVPSAIAQPGYVFYEWQKLAANDKGDVVYLAHFHKLPITHFEFETSTEAEQEFTTHLVGDAQNYPLYKPKAGTTLPAGVSLNCNGDTCTISGTPHITDWKPGETQRVIELHFEAVDQHVVYDKDGVAQRVYRGADGKDHPLTDAYGRSSFGIQKEIVVKLVVHKPAETQPPAPAPEPELTPEQLPEVGAERDTYKSTGKARHARLPQTSDKGVATSAAELLGMGFGALGAFAFTRRRKQRKLSKPSENGDVNKD